MPQFGRGKKHIGNKLRSNATAGEGTQNILCAIEPRISPKLG
jgi:hypothetical protein